MVSSSRTGGHRYEWVRSQSEYFPTTPPSGALDQPGLGLGRWLSRTKKLSPPSSVALSVTTPIFYHPPSCEFPVLELSIFSEATQTCLAEHNESWSFVAGRNEVDLRPGFPFLAKMITPSTGRADQPQINERAENQWRPIPTTPPPYYGPSDSSPEDLDTSMKTFVKRPSSVPCLHR